MKKTLATALFAGFLSISGAWAEDAAQDTKMVQAAETVVNSCLEQARTQAPDATAHDRRILLASSCICSKAPGICHGGMPQDYRTRQRISEDK